MNFETLQATITRVKGIGTDTFFLSINKWEDIRQVANLFERAMLMCMNLGELGCSFMNSWDQFATILIDRGQSYNCLKGRLWTQSIDPPLPLRPPCSQPQPAASTLSPPLPTTRQSIPSKSTVQPIKLYSFFLLTACNKINAIPVLLISLPFLTNPTQTPRFFVHKTRFFHHIFTVTRKFLGQIAGKYVQHRKGSRICES